MATVVVLFGSIGVAELTGSWVTGGRQPTAVAGRVSAAELKGWMTIQQAADGLGITADSLITLIDPERGGAITPGTQLRVVEAVVPGFSLPGLRSRLSAQPGSAPASASPTRTP